MKRLGGWNRLFVVVGVAHALFVAAVTWQTWPGPASVSHDFAFYSRLPDHVRASILNVQVLPENEREFIREAKAANRAKNVLGYNPNTGNAVDAATEIKIGLMSNGHELVFRESESSIAMDAAAKAYWDVVQREVPNRRTAHLKTSLIWWLIPLAFAYALGLAVRWVYLGFRGPLGQRRIGA